jgi:hypothetical protein
VVWECLYHSDHVTFFNKFFFETRRIDQDVLIILHTRICLKAHMSMLQTASRANTVVQNVHPTAHLIARMPSMYSYTEEPLTGNLLLPAHHFGGTIPLRAGLSKITSTPVCDRTQAIMSYTGKDRHEAAKVWRDLPEEKQKFVLEGLDSNEGISIFL